MQVSDVLIKPLVTEKVTLLKTGRVYTFEVSRKANKIQVKQAVKEIFNVEPIKCQIMVIKPKKKAIRNRQGYGKTSFKKKAMVTIKSGQTISELDS